MAELSNELKTIKKLYGENFMKMCRTLFPSLLENEGLLLRILTSNFANNARTLYEDINYFRREEKFKNYIYSKVDVEAEEKHVIESKSPYELLDKVGYDLYECNNEEEIQKFKRYYKPGEELCTFHGGRLDRCVVFWAVKKNAEEIKREDFEHPQREDDYGTSVMGIQFTKQGVCTVSIKNRYNHTVNNPDATYGNNLDKIAPGLKQAFADLLLERGLELNSSNEEKFSIPGYVKASDGKYYKYNMETYGQYCCPGNVIIDGGHVRKLEPEKQILIENFILDLENKTIKQCDFLFYHDSFVDFFNERKIEKIEVAKDKEVKDGSRIINIKMEGQKSSVIIKIDKDNRIIGYENEELREIGNKFLYYGQNLQQLKLTNLQQVGNSFLHFNGNLQQLKMPNVQRIGDVFLPFNKDLQKLELPNLQQVGNDFLRDNRNLQQLEMPNLQNVGDSFLCYNTELVQLKLPSLLQTGDDFLYFNKKISQVEMPNLKVVGNNFLNANHDLLQLELPNLKQVGDRFLLGNRNLQQLYLPNLQQAGDLFLYNNDCLLQLELPNLQQVGEYFLRHNYVLLKLELPKLSQMPRDLEEKIKQTEYRQMRQKQKSQISTIEIAKLDKKSVLTTKEINDGKRTIEKVEDLFNEKDNNDR